MAKAKATELTNFAIRRAITPTPARMYSVMPDDSLIPVKVERSSILGTQGQYGLKIKEGKDVVGTNNIQSVDTANLHPDSDTLSIQFGLKVFRESGSNGANIEMCNIQEVEHKVRDLNEGYAKLDGFRVLAEAYATQIVSCSWMWRNRIGSGRKLTIRIQEDGQKADTLEVSHSMDADAAEAALSKLTDAIETGLSGQAIISLDIDGRVTLGKGQEVYPSQEIASQDNVSRVYYQSPDMQAMMHSQKLGNAIRTIDIWHPATDLVGALPVEPYGSSIKKQEAFRYGNKRSFYDHLGAIIDGSSPILEITNASSSQDLEEITDVHYFFACLIRGGVFGMKKS